MGDPDLRIDAFTDIGSKINVKTLDGDEIKAKVFGYGSANESDSKQKVLVLHDQGSSPFLTNISIIKEDCIESFSEYEKAEDGDLPPLPLVDENRSREREARAIRVAEIAAANIGVGVTEEAQEVFNALAKTLPCTWQGTAIVVMDEVVITDPYGPENCESINPDDTTALDRVKKVLIAERSKLFG